MCSQINWMENFHRKYLELVTLRRDFDKAQGEDEIDFDPGNRCLFFWERREMS